MTKSAFRSPTKSRHSPDRSLIQIDDQTGGFRYRLLETVRELAAGKLAEYGPEERLRTQAAHRDHYLALAETESTKPHIAAQSRHLDRFDVELDNFRAALTFSLRDPDPVPGLRLLAALSPFSRARGHEHEFLQALESHLARSEASAPTRLRAVALRHAAQTASMAGSIDRALAFADEALAIARRERDARLTAEALDELGHLRLVHGDYDGSLEVLTEALQLARTSGDDALIAHVLATYGTRLRNSAEPTAAAAAFSEVLELFRRTGDEEGIASALCGLGECAALVGDLATASVHFQAALDIVRPLENQYAIVVIATNLARVTHLLGDDEAALDLALDAVERGYDHRHGVGLAYALLALALATNSADSLLAATIHGATDRLAADIGLRFEKLEADVRKAAHDALREQLGSETFEAAYRAGWSQTTEELVDQAGRITGRPPDARLGAARTAARATP